MAPRSKKRRLGKGAKCSVLLKNLRPSAIVAATFVNYQARDRLDDLVVIGQEVKSRGGKTFDAILFRSDTVPDETLWCASRWAVVTQEGDPSEFFDQATPAALEPGGVPAAAGAGNDVEIDTTVFNASNQAEDIALVRNMGFDVDDDNEPAEENIPTNGETGATDTEGLYAFQRWGWSGIDQRRTTTSSDQQAGFHNEWSPKGKSWLDIFLHLFPLVWMKNVLLKKTSDALKDDGQDELTFGELLRYIGLWLLMATCSGWTHDDYWSPEPFDEKHRPCPYNFRAYMSRSRFEAITRELRFTDKDAPPYLDKFWEVRQMIKEWNANMVAVFIVSWAICLDESMSIWFNRWTCPGWVFCPRKPHPFGNEYHTACCALSGIMFVIELVEGKDRPKEMAPPEFENLGKTVGLLLRMLKSVFHTGRYVILDSGFCVLKALIELKKLGVYACALIKKRRYWPTLVPGDAMERRFASKNVGDVDAIEGISDGVNYTLWGMKEPDYVMRMMATGGPLSADDSCRTTTRRVNESTVTFQYTRPYDWHFRYRHAVDDHNNNRHALPSLEDTWRTTRWPVRVFTFLLALTEVNTWLVLRVFVFIGARAGSLPKYHEFRRRLAWQFIDNKYLHAQPVAAAQPYFAHIGDHTMQTSPPKAREYRNRKWVCDAKQTHQQYTCSVPGCKKKVRTYCVCTPGAWLCTDHMIQHAVEEALKANAQN